MNEFTIVALTSHGDGISGGDRIYIELARNISKKLKTSILTWSEGKAMINRQSPKASNSLNIKSYKFPFLRKGGNFLSNYFLRIILSIKLGLSLKIKSKIVIYSASEFWPDVFCAALLKYRFPKEVTWVATWYQTAPNPLKGFSEGEKRKEKYRFKAFMYWLVQRPSMFIIKKFADKVVVNNESERKVFSNFDKNNIFVMIGAVPLHLINSFIKRNKKPNKKYDAVFQGRFHVQKGVLEIIDIWKKVAAKRPGAKLAMIGDGPLMPAARNKIKRLNLQDNIIIFGYLFDGEKKLNIFNQSKIVVHPAFYDSGGMASAEAMAFGLPCVGFDLKAYKSYYPVGMVKVGTGNLLEFSDAIIKLLSNTKIRNKVGREAKKIINSKYSWKSRADEFYNFAFTD